MAGCERGAEEVPSGLRGAGGLRWPRPAAGPLSPPGGAPRGPLRQHVLQ